MCQTKILHHGECTGLWALGEQQADALPIVGSTNALSDRRAYVDGDELGADVLVLCLGNGVRNLAY